MRSYSRLAVLVLAVATVACGADTAAHNTARGPARMAILSGDNQVAQVAAPDFPKPVVGQLYRAPDGTVAWRWSDAFLPAKAEAGTTVTVKGAPITNAVVCWADVPGAPRLIPFSVCTNTDANGSAAFSIRPDTAAGHAKGQVHWDSAGTPIVTDSVQETVTPGALAHFAIASGRPEFLTKGSALQLVQFLNTFTDRYGNAISPDSVVAQVRIRSAWAKIDLSARPYQCVMPTAPTDSGWTITVPDSVAAWQAVSTTDADNACLLMYVGSDTVNAGSLVSVK